MCPDEDSHSATIVVLCFAIVCVCVCFPLYLTFHLTFPLYPGSGRVLTAAFFCCTPLVQRCCQRLYRVLASSCCWAPLLSLHCRKAPSAAFEYIFVLTLYLSRLSTFRPPLLSALFVASTARARVCVCVCVSMCVCMCVCFDCGCCHPQCEEQCTKSSTAYHIVNIQCAVYISPTYLVQLFNSGMLRQVVLMPASCLVPESGCCSGAGQLLS